MDDAVFLQERNEFCKSSKVGYVSAATPYFIVFPHFFHRFKHVPYFHC
jgi:hypothetical protein